MNPFAVTTWFALPVTPMLLDAAFKSVVLLAVVLLVLRAMPRCSAATRHLTLLLGITSLLLFPFLSWALPKVNLLPLWMDFGATGAPSTITTETTPALTRPDIATAPTAPRAEKIATNTTIPPAAEAATPRAESRPTAPTRAGLFWQWAPLVWVAGVLCVLAPAAGGLLSLARLQRTTRMAISAGRSGGFPTAKDVALRATFQQLTQRLPGGHRIRLVVTPRRPMPMTWSFLAPTIVLPAQATEWSVERQRAVLLHELAHIRRRDFATTLLVRFTCALYWFNPLVWYAARRLRLAQEQACDDAVLAAGAQPTGYAEDLLHIAAARCATSLETVCALAIGRPSTLEGRLLAILDPSRDRSAPSRAVIILTALLSGVLLISLAMLRGQDVAAVDAIASSATSVLSQKADASPSTLGLVAWWRAEGDGNDSHGKHHGKFPFGISYLPGIVGQAFDFRRSYAIRDLLPRVSVPDSPEFQLSETMTLEVRIHPLRFGGIVLIRGDDRPGYDTWQLDLITPGKISYNFDSAENKSVEITAPIELSKWHHVVATFEHGAMKLYLNGVCVAEKTTELRPNPILDPARGAWLGIGNTGGEALNIPFDGLIDEVKIYNRALSEAEIGERQKT